MIRNIGHKPANAAGKRVRGYLANGSSFGMEQVSTTSPLGWAVETTRFTLRGSPFDVYEYEVMA